MLFKDQKGAEPLYRALSEILTQMELIDSAHLMEPFPSHRVVASEHPDNREFSSGNVALERELDDFRPNSGSSTSMNNYKITEEDELNDEDFDSNGVTVSQSNYEEIRF